MSISSLQNDTLDLQFFDPLSGNNIFQLYFDESTFSENSPLFKSSEDSINNYTSIHLQKDFFTPSNGLTFVIEDNRALQFSNFMQRGLIVKISINGKMNMIGYIFNYHLHYNKQSGTTLTVQCKDLLEYMAQATIFPNMGTDASTNLHFKPTDTLKYCLQTIAQAFWNNSVSLNNSTKLPALSLITVTTDNSGSLQIGSGFAAGLGSKGKKPTSTKSLSQALNHLSTPMKGESHLAYMLRLCKLAGASLKMSNNNANEIICKSPTYDTDSPFQIWHTLNSPTNQWNNVIDASINYPLDHQPSVVIFESNVSGNGQFYVSTAKGVAINALTGYSSPNVTIPSVTRAIATSTSGVLGSGYNQMPFNSDLFQQQQNMAVGIKTTFSSPYYTVSSNAHTAQEAMFGASEYLASCQDNYVELLYRVQGWTMPGTPYVWQPDMMCQVTDDILFPDSSQGSFPMWIKRVNFVRDRHSGTYTDVLLSLPFTHPVVTTE